MTTPLAPEIASVIAAVGRAHPSHPEGVYAVPWYLVVGDPGSGRTTAIHALHLTWSSGDGPLALGTPNAFYLAWEDGNLSTGVNGFNNDGDFNDDVYFFTGLTCSGGGQPCETGLHGVCSPGIAQCTAQGLTCDGLVDPSTESCDGLDNNCDGTIDEGNLCPAGEICDKGKCVGACSSGEFTCPTNLVCINDYCVEQSCANVTCQVGEVCIAGTCKAPCTDVICPYPQVCRVGICVDPCATVTCEANQRCDKGVCVPNCACWPCAAGLECDSAPGLCVPSGCAGVTCDTGTHCEGGTCVDNCAGAVCPVGQICQSGQCIDDPSNANSSSSSGFVNGAGVGGQGGNHGTGVSAGGAGAGGAPGSSGTEDGAGCGCRVSDRGGQGMAVCGISALLLGWAARRRRRWR